MLNCSEQSGIAVIELNRPPVNVLNMELMEALGKAFAAASGARGLLLRGAGKCFSAGADVAEHLPGKVETMIPLFSRVVHDLLALETPTMAFVHGSAFGGALELALACDLVVASEDARLGLPEITLGVFPPVAAAMLPDEIGRRRALELILSGDPVSAKYAAEVGLINRVGTWEDALKLLQRIASHPRPALIAAKRAARAAFATRVAAAERIYLDELMSHPEPLEGLQAFLEKRPPSWRKSQ